MEAVQRREEKRYHDALGWTNERPIPQQEWRGKVNADRNGMKNIHNDLKKESQYFEKFSNNMN